MGTLLVLGALGRRARRHRPASAERLAIVRFEVNGNVPPRSAPDARRSADRRPDGGLLRGAAPAREAPVAGRSIPRAKSAATRSATGAWPRPLKVSYLVAAQIEERQKTFEITLELLTARTRRGGGHQPRALRDLRRGRSGREDVAGGVDPAGAPRGAGPGARALRDSHPPRGAAGRRSTASRWARPRSTSACPPASATMVIEREGFKPARADVLGHPRRGRGARSRSGSAARPSSPSAPPAGPRWAPARRWPRGDLPARHATAREVSCAGSERDTVGNCPRGLQDQRRPGASLLGASAVVGHPGRRVALPGRSRPAAAC